jgi:hypothetical protein
VRSPERQRRAEAGVLAPRRDRQRIIIVDEIHGDAGVGQLQQPLAGGVRCRIIREHHHPPHARCDQRVGARRRPPVVRARLERDVDRRVARALLRDLQRHRLGVRPAGRHVPAFGDDRAVARDHAADERIGRGGARPTLGKLERALEQKPVGVVDHPGSVREPRYAMVAPAARTCSTSAR